MGDSRKKDDVVGMHSYMTYSSSVAFPWRLLASGSTLLPDSADAMAWTIADHGF